MRELKHTCGSDGAGMWLLGPPKQPPLQQSFLEWDPLGVGTKINLGFYFKFLEISTRWGIIENVTTWPVLDESDSGGFLCDHSGTWPGPFCPLCGITEITKRNNIRWPYVDWESKSQIHLPEGDFGGIYFPILRGGEGDRRLTKRRLNLMCVPPSPWGFIFCGQKTRQKVHLGM